MKFENKNFQFQIPSLVQAKQLLRDRLSGKEQFQARLIDKPLVLYGAGNLGHMACDYLRKINVAPCAIVDAKAPMDDVNSWFDGYPLLNSRNVPEKLKSNSLLAICIVSASFEEIRQNMLAQGWLDIVPFYDIAESYRHIHPLSNGWFAEPFSDQDLVEIELVLEGYADDVSRAHYLQFLAWRRLRQEWHFDGIEVQVDNRFFISEIKSKLGKNEIFVDIGAHHGSVSDQFIKEAQGEFEKIIAIEPDKTNYLYLNECFKGQPKGIKEKLRIFSEFVAERSSSRKFCSGLGYASQFSELGEEIVNTKTIDSLNLEPTYMKIHLEGFELPALKGALRTISRFRPKISLTVYHNSDGIYSTMAWLMKNIKNYTFIFRMHGWCGTGAVIYCIPI